jgi:hypothetical protein
MMEALLYLRLYGRVLTYIQMPLNIRSETLNQLARKLAVRKRQQDGGRQAPS